MARPTELMLAVYANGIFWKSAPSDVIDVRAKP